MPWRVFVTAFACTCGDGKNEAHGGGGNDSGGGDGSGGRHETSGGGSRPHPGADGNHLHVQRARSRNPPRKRGRRTPVFRGRYPDDLAFGRLMPNRVRRVSDRLFDKGA